MNTIRLSLRAAKTLLTDLAARSDVGLGVARAFAELESSISKAERTSSRRVLARKPKAEKKAAKRDETSAIREAVFARATTFAGHARCEFCDMNHATDLHHVFGRIRVRQSVENTMAVCRWCHRRVTDNQPSAAHWLERTIRHLERYGYVAEVAKASARLAFVEARGGQ